MTKTGSKEELSFHIQECIEKALKSESKLDHSVFGIHGFTSNRIRHFLNNVGSMPGLDYLEVGVHKGATFVAANYKNEFRSSTAIDNWCEFDENGQSKAMFEASLWRFFKNKFLGSDLFQPLNQDFFTLTKSQLVHPVNVYFYDGHHSEEAQYKALTHMYDMLADEFIFICDDWNWEEVPRGTRRAIKDLGLNTFYEREFKGELKNNEFILDEGWWNGFYVSVLEKT